MMRNHDGSFAHGKANSFLEGSQAEPAPYLALTPAQNYQMVLVCGKGIFLSETGSLTQEDFVVDCFSVTKS